MPATVDVIVIGAGHNGLVAATLLARAGQRVLVLERRPQPGGLAVTEPIAPGYLADLVLGDAGTFRPETIRRLFLRMQGVEMITPDPVLLALQPNGPPLPFWRDPARTAAAIAPLSAADAAAFPAYADLVATAAGFVEAALAAAPPNLERLAVSDLPTFARLGAGFRALGGRGMYDVLRLLPMSVAEFVQRHFGHDLVQAALAHAGVRGSRFGPMAAGTTYLALTHHLGHRAGGLPATAQVRGGIGRLTDALVAAASHAGAKVRCDAPVAHIILRGGRATGVALANGDDFHAPIILSNANPRHTFLELIDPYELEAGFVQALDRIRYRGVTAMLHLALRGLPRVASLPPEATGWLGGRLLVGPSLAYLERAADAAKYGGFSPEPVLEIRVPSLNDPDRAPPGHHIMSIAIQCAPFALSDGTWADAGPALEQTVLATLRPYFPDLETRIVARRLLTPADLADTFGSPEGSLTHGEMTLDQSLFMRPVPGWGNYRSPVPGLYLGGSGAHPGGGLTGEPGRLAAEAILRDRH